MAGETEARAGLSPGLRMRPRNKAGDTGLSGRDEWAVVRVGEAVRVRWTRVEGVEGADTPGLVLPLDGRDEGELGWEWPFPEPLAVPPGPGPDPGAPLTSSAKTSLRHFRTRSFSRRFSSWWLVLRRMLLMCLPSRVD